MTYVIALPCVDIKDRACVEECPVDCIYEGGRSLYIHPDECVDCGACEPVCPVEAIYYEDDLPEKWAVHTEDNAEFFTDTLPGLNTHWAARAARQNSARYQPTPRWCTASRRTRRRARTPERLRR